MLQHNSKQNFHMKHIKYSNIISYLKGRPPLNRTLAYEQEIELSDWLIKFSSARLRPAVGFIPTTTRTNPRARLSGGRP